MSEVGIGALPFEGVYLGTFERHLYVWVASVFLGGHFKDHHIIMSIET